MTFGILGIGALFGVLFNFGRIALLFGIAWYFAARAFGTERLPGSARLPAEYYRDALWIGLGGTCRHSRVGTPARFRLDATGQRFIARCQRTLAGL